MMLTISVPKNKLRPTFFCGFLISPAIKVTPVHASEEKMEPTIAAENPESKAVPPIEAQVMVSRSNEREPQTSVQFAFQIYALESSKKPKTTNPNKESILMIVRKVCNSLPFLTPLLLM